MARLIFDFILGVQHWRLRSRILGDVGSTSPSDAIAKRIADTRAHFDHAEDLLADVRHAVIGSPHASHHVFVNLPDPHPTTVHERFTGVPRCSTRFADLPLWPAWHVGDEALLFEHVVGQLLFASRFGTAASCSDYSIHWGAGADACAELATDPVAFLKREGALASVRAVLDRRKRDLAIAELEVVLAVAGFERVHRALNGIGATGHVWKKLATSRSYRSCSRSFR